jgi:hypothetical protein
MTKSKLSSVVSKITNFSDNHPIVFPFVLLGFALVAYGLFITKLGFYWDDWPPILLSHLLEKSMVWKYFIFDRPFQSWTYYLLFPICRDSAFLWQLSAILARWTAGLTLFYAFLQVFPRQKNLLQWAAVLFVVFPGFADQFASVSYGSHFIVYTVFGLSLLFMLLAFKNPTKFWVFYPFSLVFALIHLFTMEYFVGLELLRPLLLFWLFSDNDQKKSKGLLKAILYWLPFIAVLGFYVYWRMVIYPNPELGYGTGNYPYLFKNLLKAPADTLVALIQTIYSDFRFLMVEIWTDRLLPAVIEIKSLTFWLALVIGIGFTFVMHFFFHGDKANEEKQLKGREIIQNVVLSLVIFLIGLFPVWSSLRQITKGKWSDRFDIPVMFGIAILLITLITIVVNNKKTRNVILILITGLSISYQIQTANDYRKDFNRQKAFYTQLAWRIPSLEPGTTIFSPGIPTGKEADYSISMGINLLFNSGTINPSLDYWFTTPRYYLPLDLATNPSISIEDGLRIFNFKGTASKVVSINMSDDGCLRVIDHYYAIYPEKINQFYYYGELTNQDVIGETASKTNQLSKIINTGSQNTWCYFFEKGDLAQSKGKFEEAVQYYEQAAAKKLAPLEAAEYLPFIKAYANLGKIDKAVELTKKSYQKETLSNQSTCQFWHDLLEANPKILLTDVESVYNPDICKNLEP